MENLLAAADAALAPVAPAIRDLGLLESALARPRASAFGADAYPGLFEKTAGVTMKSAGIGGATQVGHLGPFGIVRHDDPPCRVHTSRDR
jgi:hypothetical protein